MLVGYCLKSSTISASAVRFDIQEVLTVLNILYFTTYFPTKSLFYLTKAAKIIQEFSFNKPVKHLQNFDYIQAHLTKE